MKGQTMKKVRYGVAQEQDWNTLSDEEFCQFIRSDFEKNYPTELRYKPHRLRWSQLRDWYMRMAGKGWLAPAWPTEFGGMGLSLAKLLIFLEEQERWGIARYQDHGVLMIGPLLFRFGTEAQRQRYLPPILSLKTRAEREGDYFVINGQKTWTTLAMDATHIFVLARTDATVKKQEGISFLLVDIKTPGVRIRPIRDIAGNEEFCEVFFENVRVPTDNMLGELNQGWTVAKSLLGFERIMLGSPKFCEYGLQVLGRIAAAAGATADPVFRDKFNSLKLDVAHLADAYEGFARLLVLGEPIGQDVSLLKIWSTETFQRIAELGLETSGSAAALHGDIALGTHDLNVLGAWYKARPATIYGGSNEIQRNIIATQVLNLPAR
jgi:alkylation response protein AidB-like acyl-CoA dehydrogenase